MRTWLHRWPMLGRVLAIMLLGVLAVQLLNFALLQFVPLPQPPAFTVEQVAEALRTKRSLPGELRLLILSRAPEIEGGRAVPIGAQLARRLGLPAEQVRLTFRDPPLFGPKPARREPGRGPPPERMSMLMGDFTAAVRQTSGDWLAVRPVRSGMAAWRERLLFWLLAALVAVAPFSWWLARWVSRPIAMFAAAAERLGRDPRATPLALSGPREIADAANAFNDMQHRLNRYVDDRTFMMGAIAHDLRTPLMRLSMRLERVPAEEREVMQRDLADMESMIAAATAYVRDASEPRPRRRLDLRSLAETVADEHADQGESVAVLRGEPVVIEGNRVTLKAMIDNLVTNAIRYAGTAEITVESRSGNAVLAVRDHGPGATPEDLPRLFEPFFRGERSRNRQTGGIGLGLASVRLVVSGHGGEVSATNHPDGGLLVVASIPLPRQG